MKTFRIVGVAALMTTSLLFQGCGYRAPMHASDIPEVQEDAYYDGVRSDYQELAALMVKDTGMEPTTGNTVGLVNDQHQKFELLLDDVSKAEESIYIDHYRFCYDSCGSQIADLLIDQAAAGKDVRVIIDKGAHKKEDMKGHAPLVNSQVDFFYFRFPVMLLDHLSLAQGTHRDHRKIVILDGKTAYTGGRNIQDRYFETWRDADIRVTGPAVNDLISTFNENQFRVAPDREPVPGTPEEVLRTAAVHDSVPGLRQFYDKTMQVIPDSPTDRRLPIRNAFLWSIDHARNYFWFYNPYTPPPAQIIKALKNAAARGVDVCWIVPANNDVKPEKWMGESMYKDLLKAGVRIFEYQGPVLHVKQFMVDDYLSCIGSANMDNLSFFLNYEVQTLIFDEEFTRHASEIFEEDIEEHCQEITLEEVRHWSIFRKIRNGFVRWFGPLG